MNTIIKISVAFVVPGIFSLILTPGVIRLANFIGAIDHPDERKVHSHPIPRLGGVAIFISFLSSLVIFYFFDPTRASSLWIVSHQGIMLIASLLLVFLLGIWDDLQSLKPGQKFLIQLIAATIAYLAGFRISSVTHPLGESIPLALGMLDFPATILWIVGVSNAFNLVDGLDGLASGIALIAASTIGAIAYLNGDMTTAIPAFILGGALIGFLWYNFNPARIFLGDSGSLFIGFALAILSMQSSTKGSTAFAIVVPILCVGLPIMDTLLSMTRRLLSSLLPERLRRGSFLHKLHSMFLPDKKHIHHQLLARGYSQRRAVLILYVVSCLFGLGAFGVTILNNTQASLILIAVAIATMIGVRQLHYREMALFHNGILLPIYDSPVINGGFFQVFMDLVFSLLAFRFAFYLIPQQSLVQDFEQYLHPLLAVVCGLQIAVFALLGLYQRTFRYLGVGD
ncbi:MAG: undecaprenyl/decaprenyl-phosphate alpha-N-acetylglucosaminyl 1-phosphate transferase, partial [Ignavibacteriales bacterium]|nr:undecaprenyl/decaprenyl-phosphate alpha-N-acetylglucosaminyl 1-phosphate transferase [Ignavibacteriales bacterium]